MKNTDSDHTHWIDGNRWHGCPACDNEYRRVNEAEHVDTNGSHWGGFPVSDCALCEETAP